MCYNVIDGTTPTFLDRKELPMLQAGFARLDITPPLGHTLAGYFHARVADGILDPLELNAIAIGNGTDTVILITADLISMDARQSLTIRELIEKECGVPAEHVVINCLHQHTTVRIGGGLFGIQSGYYLDFLRRKCVDAARLAIEDMRAAKLGIAEAETARPISFIRRYRMKDGSFETNPSRKYPERIDCPMGKADNTVRLVRFFREGAKDIALVAFATHPDVIGGNKYSADWPGFVRRYMEEALADVHCALFNGAQGDTNHLDPYVPTIPDRYAFSAQMGRVITDAALSIWEKTTPCEGETVFGSSQVVYNKTRTDGEERYEEMKRFYAAYEAGTLDHKPSIAELGEARRIIGIRTAPIYQPITVSVIGFANIRFVGFGGEPFTDYAHTLRAALTDQFVLTGCNTNGSVGYLPTASAFAEGGYEGRGTALSPDLQDQLISAALTMMQP